MVFVADVRRKVFPYGLRGDEELVGSSWDLEISVDRSTFEFDLEGSDIGIKAYGGDVARVYRFSYHGWDPPKIKA